MKLLFENRDMGFRLGGAIALSERPGYYVSTYLAALGPGMWRWCNCVMGKN